VVGVVARRGIAVGMGLLAVGLTGLRVAYSSDPSWLGLAVFLLPLMVMLAAGVAAVLLIRRRRYGPAEFIVRGPGVFGVPPATPALLTPVAMVAVTPTGTAMAVETVHRFDPANDGIGLLVLYAPVFVVVLPATVAVLVTALFGVWAGRPALDLTPAGLRLRNLTGTVTVPWEALRPGTPVRPRPRTNLALVVDRFDLVRRRGLVLASDAIPVWALHVHPWFPADVIRHYATYPDYRGAIGTAAEYQRLRQILGVEAGAPVHAG